MDLEHELRALREELARQEESYETLQFDAAAVEEPERLFRLSDDTHERIGALAGEMTPVRIEAQRPVFAIHV